MNLYLVCIKKDGITGETQRVFLCERNARKWMTMSKLFYTINHDVDLTLVIEDLFDIDEFDVSIKRIIKNELGSFNDCNT